MALITNIIKKVKDEGFVRFVGGNLLDGQDNIIDSIADPGVGGGVAGTVVIAYASSPVGAGFTLTNSDTLEYIAFKYFPEGATPIAADFSGLWFHRKGLPGDTPTPIPGTNGQASGFRVNIDILTAAAKPGTGKIRANNANWAIATELYLDEMMPSGVDLSGVINLLKDGMLFMVRPSANVSAPLFVYELTADPVDNGDWFTMAVVNKAASSTAFVDGDECTFQFFGAGAGGAATVSEAAVIAAGNFLRAASNGAGGYNIIDNTNTVLKPASPVYKLPSITISGVTNIPAANTFPHGSVVRLHQDNLVGAGANVMGVRVKADAVNNIWRPDGPQVLFSNRFGTLATPTLSLTAAGKFDLGAGGDPVFPAALLHANAKLVFRLDLKKVGTTTPTVRINFGTDLAARENNSIVYTQFISATANVEIPGRSETTFLSATTAICILRAALGGGGAAGSFLDASTLLNVASAMKATIEASTLATDTVHLLGFQFVWEE